jgi:hypothetical protein
MPVMDFVTDVSAPVTSDVFVLRVDLKEPLSVGRFELILFRIRESYDAIDRFTHLFERLRMNTGQFLDGFYYNRFGFVPSSLEVPWDTFRNLGIPLVDFLPAMNPYIISLQIKRISIASPGFCEFFGSLNPLRVIADFVTNYPSEDTKRMKIRSDELLKREQLRATFIRDFFKLMPNSYLLENPDRVIEITRTVIEPAFRHLESIATDTKVTRVVLVPQGDQLPPEEQE